MIPALTVSVLLQKMFITLFIYWMAMENVIEKEQHWR